MNAKCKLYLIQLIVVGLSVSIASCLTAPTPSQTNGYTEGAARLGLLFLRIRVDRPKQPCLKGGELLDINFTVTNEGQIRRLEVLESKDKPVMDVFMRESPSMKSVYSWAEQNPDKAQHRVEWQPGESQTINVKWQLPQKEYAHQNLDIIGSVHVDDIRYGAFAVVSLCLGSPSANDLLILPTPKGP
jgi:hypothetical protein